MECWISTAVTEFEFCFIASKQLRQSQREYEPFIQAGLKHFVEVRVRFAICVNHESVRDAKFDIKLLAAKTSGVFNNLVSLTAVNTLKLPAAQILKTKN